MDPTKLRVYNRARAIVDEVLPLVAQEGAGGSRRIFEQIRASSTSITHNIAEACGRTTTAERLQMLSHANGSLWETVDGLSDLVALLILEPDDQRRMLSELKQISTQIALLAASIADADPEYKGAYHHLAERGRRIRERNQKKRKQPEPEKDS